MVIKKAIRFGAVMALAFACLLSGCRIWRGQSHLQGIDAAGTPRTQNKYWIRLLPGGHFGKDSDWGKCLALYQRRMPSVFSERGQPVFIEIDGKLPSSNGAGWCLLNALLSGCSCVIIPYERGSRIEYRISVSLNEKMRKSMEFTVVYQNRQWEGLLAPFGPMPTIEDQRFVHSAMSTCFENGVVLLRKDYVDLENAGMLEHFCGAADAIVQGVACYLQQVEAEQRKATQSRRIGD